MFNGILPTPRDRPRLHETVTAGSVPDAHSKAADRMGTEHVASLRMHLIIAFHKADAIREAWNESSVQDSGCDRIYVKSGRLRIHY